MPSYHVHSNSLPSRPHPTIPEFSEQLCRVLRASEATSSSASTTISCKLSDLQDLLNSVERLLSLPFNQQALSQVENQKQVDQILDESLRLMDICKRCLVANKGIHQRTPIYFSKKKKLCN